MNIETQSWICTFFFSICNHHNMPEALKRSTSLSSSVLFIMQNAKSIYNQQQKHRDILKLFTHFSCICTNMHTLTLRHVYTDTHTGKDLNHHDNCVSCALRSLRVHWCSAARLREGCLCGRTGVRIETH